MRGKTLLKGSVLKGSASAAAMLTALAVGASPAASCSGTDYGFRCVDNAPGSKNALHIQGFVPGTTVTESNTLNINVTNGYSSAIQIYSGSADGPDYPGPAVTFLNTGALSAASGGILVQASNTVSIVNEGRISGLNGMSGIGVETGGMYYSPSLDMMMPGPGGAIHIDNRAAITAAAGSNWSPAIYANAMTSEVTVLNSGNLRGGNGGSVIAAQTGMITTDGQNNPLVVGGGNVSVDNSGRIAGTGMHGRAIYAYSVNGGVSVTNSGAASADGDRSDVISASSGAMTNRNDGTLEIVDGMSVSVVNSGRVENTGSAEANGIRAFSNGSSVLVANDFGGNISTAGSYSAGITAGTMMRGSVIVGNAGSVKTEGFRSAAIQAYSEGEVRDWMGNVIQSGMSGDVNVANVGRITTSGDQSGGIEAMSGSGRVNVINDVATPAMTGFPDPVTGRIMTTGMDSTGIGGFSRTGAVDVANNGVIVTTGMGSGAIGAHSDTGEVRVANAGIVRGMGDFSNGIEAETGGESGSSTAMLSAINNGVIKMYGAGSKGISTHADLGTNSVSNSGNITVGATVAPEVAATIRFEAPAIAAGQSIGILATANGGNVDVMSSGKVRAYGDDSYGIVGVVLNMGGAPAVAGSVRIDVQQGGVVQGGTGSGKFALGTSPHDVAILGSAGIGIAGGSDNRVTNAGTITGLNGVAISFGEGSWKLSHQEEMYDNNGNLIIDPATGQPRMKTVTETITLPSANNTITNLEGGKIIGAIQLGSGNDAIVNMAGGTISGDVKMGSGLNTFDNAGTFNMGAKVDLGGGTLANTGIVSPGGRNAIAKTVLTGSFEQSAAGKLMVDIDPTAAAGAKNDWIGVSGSAMLGGLVQPNLMTTSKSAVGSYRIIHGIAGATSTADVFSVKSTLGYDMSLSTVTSTAGLGAVAATADTRDVVLKIAAKSTAAMKQSLTSGASGARAANISAATDSLGSSAQGNVLRLASDASAGLGVVNSVLPLDQAAQISRSTAASLAFGAAMQNCATSVADAKVGESRGNDQSCAWGRYSFASLQVSDVPYAVAMRDDGFEGNANRRALRDQANVAYGSQTNLGNGWSLGVASAYETLGFGTSDNAAAGTGSSQGERAIAGVSLKHEKGAWQTSLNLIGTYGWYDNDRTTLAGTAHSEQQVSTTQAGMRLAYQIDSGAAYVRPMVDVNATFLRLGAYSEQGAGQWNLAVGAADKWVMSVAPGVEVGASLTGFGWTVKPYARAGVSFSSGDEINMSATFGGASQAFMVSSRMDSVMADLEAGVNLLSLDGISAKLSYQGHIGSVSEDHTGGLKVNMPF